MTRCALALGEVAWERELLAAAAGREDIELVRRHVDAAGALREVGAEVLLVSPALRGFDEKSLAALRRGPMRIVLLLDTVRPPWLSSCDVEQREVAGMDLVALFDDLATGGVLQAPTIPLREARITAFAGTGGGVGTTTLACAYAMRQQGRTYVEADRAGVSAALLLGQRQDALVAPPLGGGSELVLDFGQVDGDAPLDEWERLVLVTPATPLGIVRAGALVEVLRGCPLTLVVNRVRPSAIGTSRVSALRGIVERATGLDPLLVPDRTADCDAAWLQGSLRGIADLMPELPASVDGAQQHEAA